jgi:hypothetical protein
MTIIVIRIWSEQFCPMDSRKLTPKTSTFIANQKKTAKRMYMT